MAHLKIIEWDCSDIDDIDMWTPAEPDNIDFWVNFTIGVDGTSHNYQAHVLSPKNIDVHARQAGGLIVINNYSWETVLNHVKDILVKAPTTSPENFDYVARHFCWEYEDYKP